MHVLVIDDDRDTLANLRDILEMDSYTVSLAGSVAEALNRQDWSTFTAIILDRKLPDGNAEQLLPQLKQLAPQAAFIIVTGFGDLEGAIAAIRHGAADYMVKPISADLIRSRLAGIIERKRSEEEIVRLNTDLQHRVSELQTLLDVIPIGIAIAQDRACQRIDVNPSFARWLNIPPSSNASLSTSENEKPSYRCLRGGKELRPEELPMQVAAAVGVETRDKDVDIVWPDGRAIHLIGSAAPLFDEQGHTRGAVGAFMDVTERQREQERLLQTERLAAIGQMVTGLAHESGNALARSRACLDMLTWEVQDRPEALDLINRILKAQEHLQQLYEEVRGYASPLKLEREPWEVSGIWRQAWNNLALARRDRDASLNEQVDGLNLQCSIDPFRLEQVFRNILENSLAACPDPVRIEVTCKDVDLHGHPALQIGVRDNGPGLNAEQARRIFEPFFTTKTKGTGLGMAIAKRILEAHGGDIAVGQGAASGAEILLTLPREVP